MFEAIGRLIEKYDKIIIHRHMRPDGDALGSQMGLWHILRDSYPEKQVYAVGDMAERYAFIADHPMDEIDDGMYEGALAIILDTSAKSLISDDRYTLAAESVRIDHHIFVEQIADLEVTDDGVESCCGLIGELAIELGLTVSAAAAKALYMGMVTDSGRFRYDSTTARSFKVAAFLMERGFDISEIYKNLYSDEFEKVRLKAIFILKIQTTPHRVAYIYTTKEELAELGVDLFTASRGMVNVMSDIKGIDSWVNFTETEEGVVCEIRSSVHNINPVAVKYGGGGHRKASGATVKDRETAMSLLADLCALGEESL